MHVSNVLVTKGPGPTAPVAAAAPPKQTRIHALPGRYHELDGLRGVSALCVVAFHYLSGPAVYSHMASRIRELIFVSPLSVDLFFTLSGFLVGGILLNTRNSPNYFKTFYMRRLYRVAPIYYLWILAFVVLALCIPSTRAELLPPGYSVGGYALAHMLFTQNFPHFPYFATKAQWFGTTWSLVIEEHFYLVIPFCLFRLPRRKLIGWLSAIIVLEPFVRMFAWQVLGSRDAWGVTYVWTLFRADELAIGVLLAVLWESIEVKEWLREHVDWVFYALVATSVTAIALDYMTVKHVRYADVLNCGLGRSAVEASGLCMILFALIFQGQSSVAVMRWRWIREIGKVSYWVYLTHRGILWLVFRFMLHTGPGLNVQSDILAAVIGFALTCGLAAISWKYLEGPLQRRGHRYAY